MHSTRQLGASSFPSSVLGEIAIIDYCMHILESGEPMGVGCGRIAREPASEPLSLMAVWCLNMGSCFHVELL